MTVCSSGDQGAALSSFADTCKTAGITVRKFNCAMSEIVKIADMNEATPSASASSTGNYPPSTVDDPNQTPTPPRPPDPSHTQSFAVSKSISWGTGKEKPSSPSSTATNLLNSASSTKGASKASGTASGAGSSSSSPANAGVQLASVGYTGLVGVLAASFIGGTVLVL